MVPEHHCYDYATRNRQMLTGLLSVELSPLSPGSGSGLEHDRVGILTVLPLSALLYFGGSHISLFEGWRLSTDPAVHPATRYGNLSFFPLFCVTDSLLYGRSVTQTCSKCAKSEKIFIYYSATILISYFTFFHFALSLLVSVSI